MANDLNLPAIADGQADGQWQTSNDGDAALGNALADIYTVDFTAGNVTLTAAQFRSAMTFVPSNLSATRVLTIPAVKRGIFFVHNTDAVDSITVTKGSTTISVGPGEIGALYTDGTTNSLEGAVIAEAGAAAPVPYDIPLSYAGGPAANFSGSNGYIATNPTGSFVISVKDDGAEIGTITISTGGAFTFATSSGTAKTVAAGSRLEFVAPASADATAADIAATLEGTV